VAPLIGVLLLAATRGLALLPLTGQRWVGRMLGALSWYARLDSVRITRRNIDHCFPELETAARRRLARDSLRHTGQLLAETGVLFHWPVNRWQPLIVEDVGSELIDRALADGIPVLLLVPHYGNWEFLSLYLGRYRVTALYDPPRIAALEPMIRRARMRAGARLLPIDAGGLRRFYQSLRDGGVAALLPDQVPDHDSGVVVPFFGQPALTMTFAHRLAQRTGARLLLGSATRVPGGFRVRFSELDAQLRDPDPEVSARAMNQAIESLVREDPAQYQWEYKRFKRLGPRATSIYGGD
jgi:Kdo2-lipid IVA lauroyltransferase/acyltransferase